MERILTLAAYRQILREMQGVMGSTGYNNLYIMADTVRKAITDGKAYFLPQERGGYCYCGPGYGLCPVHVRRYEVSSDVGKTGQAADDMFGLS